MANVGYAAFSTTVEKTNQVLKAIEEAYNWPKERREQSYGALRAVLHALRDRLTVGEAKDLGAQLPMLIRGIYYEGWNLAKMPIKMDREEFLRRVRNEFPWEIEGSINDLVKTVIKALRPYISEGEYEDIKYNMPKDLAALLP